MEKPPLIAEAFLFVCSVSRSSPEPFTAGKTTSSLPVDERTVVSIF